VRRFLHADERGSIVSATDGNGNPIVTYLEARLLPSETRRDGRFHSSGGVGTRPCLLRRRNVWGDVIVNPRLIRN
jgi:hypothetical protein